MNATKLPGCHPKREQYERAWPLGRGDIKVGALRNRN
jgi:hypothetical protein